MNKEMKEALNYIKGSSLYTKDQYTREALYHIEKELSKLDKIRKMINSDNPMSYRLALIKEILKEK